MITCRDARTQWNQHLDGEVCSSELKDHIGTCPECRNYTQRMAGVVSVMAALRDDTESLVSTAASVDPRVGAQPEPKSFNLARHIFRWRAAAVLVAAVGVAIYFGSLTEPGATGPKLVDSSNNIAAVSVGNDEVLGLELMGVSASQFMAVPKPVSNSQSRVIWLYPSLPESGQAKSLETKIGETS